MSTLANILFMLKEGDFRELASGGPHNMLGGFWGVGDSVPADAVAGWQPGAFFQHTGLSDHGDALYVNIGSVTSANFNLVTVASD